MQNKITIDQWVVLMREAGISDATMTRWHRLFEAQHPTGHQEFLQWLGLDENRISQIRAAHR